MSMMQVDISNIRALFATAAGNGVAKPTFRNEQFTISVAPASGRNAGYLYVKVGSNNGGEYIGKISPVGRFTYYETDQTDVVLHSLKRVLSNTPEELEHRAREYGQNTGTCSCCGRELTNPISISLGIGPICRGYYGWGTALEIELADLDNLGLTPDQILIGHPDQLPPILPSSTNATLFLSAEELQDLANATAMFILEYKGEKRRYDRMIALHDKLTKLKKGMPIS